MWARQLNLKANPAPVLCHSPSLADRHSHGLARISLALGLTRDGIPRQGFIVPFAHSRSIPVPFPFHPQAPCCLGNQEAGLGQILASFFAASENLQSVLVEACLYYYAVVILNPFGNQSLYNYNDNDAAIPRQQ